MVGNGRAVRVSEHKAHAKAHARARWRIAEARVHVDIDGDTEGPALGVVVERSRRLLLDAYLPLLIVAVCTSRHRQQPARATRIQGRYRHMPVVVDSGPGVVRGVGVDPGAVLVLVVILVLVLNLVLVMVLVLVLFLVRRN